MLAADDGLIVFSSALDVFGGILAPLTGGEERGGIYAMRPDGSQVRQLTTFQTFNYRYDPHAINLPDDHPTLSPDGKHILFSSSRDDDRGILGNKKTENFEIYMMDVNGSNIRRLTHSAGYDGEAVFSPDGTKIVYSSECGGAPDLVVCDRNLDIYVMDLQSNVLQRITSAPEGDVEPTFSPDGQQIVFTRVFDLGGLFGTDVFEGFVGDEDKDILIADADGLNKNLRQITDTDKENHDARFHPSGSEIVVTSEIADTLPYGDVVRVRVSDGAFLENLTIDDRIPVPVGPLQFVFVGGGGDPVYSPDGSQIAYIKAQLGITHGPQKIHIMNADGSDKHKLDQGIPGLLNIHQDWGALADTDLDGTPDYLENTNTSFARDAVPGLNLLGETQGGEYFGAAIALADLTHDGQLDLVIGSPGLDVDGQPDAGNIAVLRGTEFGPNFSPGFFESLANVFTAVLQDRPEPVAAGRFGQTMVSGDFNGDGFSDVAVGAPGQSRVFVMYGGTQTQTITGSGEFGAALAAGDFNDDGRMDLAVGAPTSQRAVATGGGGVGSVAAGAVHVYFGTPTGLSTSPQVIDQGDLPTPTDVGREEPGDRFGATLAAGDLDGDGDDDLAIGVPGEDIAGVVDAGTVYVVPGRANALLLPSLAERRDLRSLPSGYSSLQTGAQFGSSLAIGNFRGGGVRPRDLIVGIPQYDVNVGSLSPKSRRIDAGLVAVFEGKNPILISASLFSGGVQAWTSSTVGDVVESNSRFGQTLSVGDFSGDGRNDLAIASPGRSVGGAAQAGAVHLVFGSAPSAGIFSCTFCGGGGLIPGGAQRLDQSSVGTAGETGDRFGGSLTFASANTLAAGDLDGDGQDDLLIGSPQEDGLESADNGLVSIRYGLNVGEAELTTSTSSVPSGEQLSVTLNWTHPEQWRELESLQLRIANEQGLLAWVKFDEATNSFQLWDPRIGSFGDAGVAGSKHTLKTRHVRLDLSQVSVVDSGPEGRELSISFTLTFHRPARRGRYNLELMATDDNGNSQGFEPAGEFELTPSHGFPSQGKASSRAAKKPEK